MIFSSISSRGLWGVQLPCLRSWNSQEVVQVNGRMSQISLMSLINQMSLMSQMSLMNQISWLVDLDTMYCTETALGKVSLPPKAYFVLGKAVHMQFNGGS